MSQHKNTTHGLSSTPTYKSWQAMKERCLNVKHRSYKYYGRVGITICGGWLDSFESFFADMGERPRGTTLDRRDSKGNYEPGNCRWSTELEQKNNKSDNVIVTLGGKSQTVVRTTREDKTSTIQRLD